MRYPRCYSIKQAADKLRMGHRKLHARLVGAGALQRDSRLPCWRASPHWMKSGWLREKEYQFYNRTTGLEQWAVKVLLTEDGLAEISQRDDKRA